MKATFALLADYPTHNTVRRLAWQMYQKYGISLETSRLPPHVSLKQPFDIADLAALESYMNELVSRMSPINITLTGPELVEVNEHTSILWLKAEQTPTLHQLHNRLNQELESRFGSTQADFDGPDYQFHMTIAIGGSSLADYRRTYEEFKNNWREISFRADAVALFAYDSINSQSDYISYKILPMSG